VRTDDYYWLRERDDPAVIAYLEAENAYTEAMMAHTADIQETLFQEIRARIKQTDESVPYKRDDHYYYTRTEDGREYQIYCRKHAALDAPEQRLLDSPEQIMIDGNQLAEGHGFFSVGSLAVSPGQDILAYSVDTVGRRFYTISFKELSTGKLLPDVIPNVTPNLTWAEDSRTLFYVRQDPTTLRSYQVYRHALGTDAAADVLVYEEMDETFNCHVYKTKSRRYIVIGSYQTLSSEMRTLQADDPQGEFVVLQPRQRDHEYDVDHWGEHFYIRTNHDGAKNKVGPFVKTTRWPK
jgi:oligopeptidase B